MKVNALIVDDNKFDRKLLASFLNTMDIVGVECSDGYEAMDKLENMSIEIIFLDVKMPTLNGFQLLKRLNKYCKRNNIPIIMMSANRLDTQGVVQSFKLGASDFLVKPISFQSLKDKYDTLKEKNKIQSTTKVKFPKNSSTILSLPCEIVNLDLHGITVVSQHAMKPNQELIINNEHLINFGITDLKLNVEKVKFSDNEYIFFLSFKKTPEHQLNKIKKLYSSFLENYKNHDDPSSMIAS